MKGQSPTSRTLQRCKKLGWLAGVVERRLPHTFTTVDLFGFVDIVAIDTARNAVVLIQATTAAHGANRVTKIQEERRDEAETCLRAGARVEVWAWRKLGHRWEPLITSVQLPEVAVDLGDVLDNLPF